MLYSRDIDPANNAFRWNGKMQRHFLEMLADTGSVQLASSVVSKTREAAYRLRRRRENAAFKAGWDAAMLIARDEIFARLMEYALGSVSLVGVRNDSQRLYWHNADPLLGRGRGTALLGRLDRALAKMSKDDQIRARQIASQFDAYLDFVEREVDNSEIERRFFNHKDPAQTRALSVNLNANSPFS